MKKLSFVLLMSFVVSNLYAQSTEVKKTPSTPPPTPRIMSMQEMEDKDDNTDMGINASYMSYNDDTMEMTGINLGLGLSYTDEDTAGSAIGFFFNGSMTEMDMKEMDFTMKGYGFGGAVDYALIAIGSGGGNNLQIFGGLHGSYQYYYGSLTSGSMSMSMIMDMTTLGFRAGGKFALKFDFFSLGGCPRIFLQGGCKKDCVNSHIK